MAGVMFLQNEQSENKTYSGTFERNYEYESLTRVVLAKTSEWIWVINNLAKTGFIILHREMLLSVVVSVQAGGISVAILNHHPRRIKN